MRKSRRYAPSRAGGTAQSSQPGHASLPSGIRVAVPEASSRTRHKERCPAGSVTSAWAVVPSRAAAHSASALAFAWATSSPPTSTNSHAPPLGSEARDASLTRSFAMPSTVSGWCWSSPAAASAAALSST